MARTNPTAAAGEPSHHAILSRALNRKAPEDKIIRRESYSLGPEVRAVIGRILQGNLAVGEEQERGDQHRRSRRQWPSGNRPLSSKSFTFQATLLVLALLEGRPALTARPPGHPASWGRALDCSQGQGQWRSSPSTRAEARGDRSGGGCFRRSIGLFEILEEEINRLAARRSSSSSKTGTTDLFSKPRARSVIASVAWRWRAASVTGGSHRSGRLRRAGHG